MTVKRPGAERLSLLEAANALVAAPSFALFFSCPPTGIEKVENQVIWEILAGFSPQEAIGYPVCSSSRRHDRVRSTGRLLDRDHWAARIVGIVYPSSTTFYKRCLFVWAMLASSARIAGFTAGFFA